MTERSPHKKPPTPGTAPEKNRPRRAMSLVEVMVALGVFSIAILGTFGLMAFGLRTMDETRAFTQATQILTHEMESIRLRSWNGSAGAGQKSIVTLAPLTQPGQPQTTFVPFADYRAGDAATGAEQPQLDSTSLGATKLQIRNATGFTCTRSISLVSPAGDDAKDQANIALTVAWTDARNIKHSRTLTSTASNHGLNDSIFILR